MRNSRKLLAIVLLVILAMSLLTVTGLAVDVDDNGVATGSSMAYSFWALVPPIVAIILALITKEVFSSLFIGVLLGALFANNFAPVGSLDTVLGEAIVPAITDLAGNFMFLVILGVLIFIDDYFNCLTVGSVMLPITDRHKVSRAKLAYLIDATAAPICMIAPISSWAAAVSSYAEDGQGFVLFVKAIPYNFYSLLSIVFVVAIILMKFDFGPMRLHEMNAMLNGDLYTSGDHVDKALENSKFNPNGKVIDLLFPVVVLIIACFIGLLYAGGYYDAGGDFYHQFQGAFTETDATVALPWGTLIALLISLVYYWCRRLITFKESMDAIPTGFMNMVPAITILTLATALKNVTGLLGAKYFVAGITESAAAGLFNFLPAIIFVIACILSFSTGTSWGTFGILIPIVAAVFGDPSTQLYYIGMSACLAGAVFGDHCSPISDTTIMASAGAMCNHVNHVATQLPYAGCVGIICFVNYIIAGFVQNAWICLVIGAAITICTLFVIRSIVSKKDVKAAA